jgi:aminoglycoside phosphotransferase (APT) family kinase protein
VVTLGQLVGRGRTAEVFAWGNDKVLKLFHADVSAAAIDREMQAAEILSHIDVPAPAFGGRVEVESRTGLVFERVVGRSMLSVLASQPWRTVAYARVLADVHWQIHSAAAVDLPSQRAFAADRIRVAPDLEDAARSAALERLAHLDDGDRLCHGDFHPDNVVITSRGPVVLDWMNAVHGAPAGDVARTLLLLEHAVPPPGASLALRLLATGLRRVYALAYWRRYAQRSGLARADLDAWRLPLFAARLAEGIPSGERTRLLALVHTELDAKRLQELGVS